MKKKIGIQMISIATVAIILTAILVMFAFYEMFQRQIWDNMKIYAQILQSVEKPDEATMARYRELEQELRVTWIAENGDVIYDSDVEQDTMDNHGERPEVVEARKHGDATQIRMSDTVNKSYYYYATVLRDGSVLRLAREADSLVSMILAGVPVIIGVALVIWLLCAILSRVLTNSLVEPIEDMASQLDAPDQVETYEELIPFVQLVKKQHEDIMHSVTMRQDFTANVSHELKTPLTAISGYSELIENGMATEGDVRRFAGEIHRSANRLLTLINDTIRLSELDSAEQNVSMEPVNLYYIAETCVNMLKINAENHDVNLEFSGKLVAVVADRQMMEELVYNLCDNAIRYNNPGGYVYVSVGEMEKEIYLKVKDTGIGIAKEHQERIFERFYRVDKSRSKSTGGTGLGLAIVKHIVARCNARIDLESKPGEGTEITVYFKKSR